MSNSGIPQFRHHVENEEQTFGKATNVNSRYFAPLSPYSQLCSRDALARKFHETHDMAVKDEIERLLKEYGKLDEPWEFVSR